MKHFYKHKINTILFLGMVFFLLNNMACKKSVDPSFNDSGFPKEIEKIIVYKCATVGCHNDKSFQNAANLNLTSWDNLFKGGNNGSVAIAYSPTQSSLLSFINTYTDLGLTAIPTMPLNADPLSREEVSTVKNWIINGCPNKKGEIPFAKNPSTRHKLYIANQGCDLVSVVDAASYLVMRCVRVGHQLPQKEVPHCLRVSPDGKYWYVCFTNGQYVQKFDAIADTFISEANIGAGKWNVIKIAPDGNHAYVSSFDSDGKLVEINLNTMTISNTIAGSGLLANPHGIAYSASQDTVYASAQYGNMVYRIVPKLFVVDQLSIQKNAAPVLTPQLLDPHEIVMRPDYKYYFISCQASNEVRVMDAKADTLYKVIPVGTYPLEFAISQKRNQLFVTCQEDVNQTYLNFVGSVYVIDMNTFQVVRKLDMPFFQPHGLAIDDALDLLFVGSRNVNPSGPAPHHTSECAGRNGFYHAINLNTWQALKPVSEVSVDPYSLDIR